MKHQILPCHYPTTTLVLDDDQSFLTSMEIFLSNNTRRFLCTSKTDHAAKLIKESDENNSHKFLNKEFKPDYYAIKNFAKNSHKDKEISALVIDFHMPEINGIDFCKKIENTLCEKILLTADSDQSIAIKAFNDGLIHHYISKQDKNLDILLNKFINQAEINYIKRKFNIFISSINNTDRTFTNKNIQKRLLDFIYDENIVEYYMIDNNGSLLCFNDHNECIKVLIKNKDDNRIPLTWQQAEYLPENLFQEIWDCKKTIGFSIEEIDFPPVEVWEKYIVPLREIPGETEYFLAIIKNYTEVNDNKK
jgi:CheY-like chemotaxis protein